MSIVRLALSALLLATAVTARAADVPGTTAAAGVACTCQACDQPVCCKAPTGFAPLDEKCRTRCRQETWTAKADQTCAGSQPQSCCRK